jgi:hypothetical protein
VPATKSGKYLEQAAGEIAGKSPCQLKYIGSGFIDLLLNRGSKPFYLIFPNK